MKIISFFLLATFLFAKVEIFATKVLKKNNIIYLNNPVIIYKDFIIQAKKGKIKNKVIYLENKVVAFYKNSNYLASKATIYSKKNVLIKDIFLIDRENNVWIKAKRAKYNNDLIDLKNIFFSSCCIKKPDWFLYSTSGNYNKKTKYIKLYNLVLYVNDFPVFYLPFYFNSLDKTRRSGLLRPYIGYSTKEGFLYSQPVYIVLGQRADFEITPTIRNLRGKGIYNTFRFVTSPFDYGEIKFGEFFDKESFLKQNQLANKIHYGFEINYFRSKVFNNDKLYLNFKKANDVDYFYLNPYNYTFDTKYLVDKLITSNLNYVNEHFNNYLFGVYSKYFIDTTKKSNDNTIQILPQFNIHKFETKKFILNSFDFNYYNFYSKNKKYYQYTFNLPISYNFNFFNDYLNLKISENFDYKAANFYNTDKPKQEFYNLYSTIRIYFSLTKKSSFIHVIDPSITFNIKQKSKISKFNDLLTYTNPQNSINFSLFQLFEKSKFYFDHTVTQNFNSKLQTLSNLENTFNIKYKNLSISDNNKYSWKKDRITYNSFNVNFLINNYKFTISHIFNYPENADLYKSYTFRAEKEVNKYKKLYVEYNFDLVDKYYKYIILGINLNKKCWQYDFSLKQERIPVLKESGISYNKNYMLIFNINFYPLGGLKQSIQFQ